MLTDTEKEILIKAAVIKERQRLEKKEIKTSQKNIYLSMFYRWLNNKYPWLVYITNLYFDLTLNKHEFFTIFKSLYPPDCIILQPNKSFYGFILYFISCNDVLKTEKYEMIKRLREMNYFAIYIKSLDEAKLYFTEYMNYD